MNKFKYHTDGSEPLNNKAVFVFGSNEAGIHGAGAARYAHTKRGLQYGVGQFGHNRPAATYGIATKDAYISQALSVYDIERQIIAFAKVTHADSNTEFFITRVGCGLAGLHDSEIAHLFKDCNPKNCSFPDTWQLLLETIGSGATSFLRVLDLVSKYHANAVDLAGLPYILHSLRVSGKASQVKNEQNGTRFCEIRACVGLAHDILEDTDCTEDELSSAAGPIGPVVVKAVKALTKRPDFNKNNEEHTTEYLLQILPAGSVAIDVKLYDLGDNSDINRLPLSQHHSKSTVTRLKKYSETINWLNDVKNDLENGVY